MLRNTTGQDEASIKQLLTSSALNPPWEQAASPPFSKATNYEKPTTPVLSNNRTGAVYTEMLLLLSNLGVTACAPSPIWPPVLPKLIKGTKLKVESKKRFIQCAHIQKRDKEIQQGNPPSQPLGFLSEIKV